MRLVSLLVAVAAVFLSASTGLLAGQTEHSVRICLSGTDDGGREERLRAVSCLARIDHPLAAVPLIALYDDADPEVSRSAGAAITDLGESGLEALVAALSDPERPVGSKLHFLAPLGQSAAIALTPLLETESRVLRKRGIAALVRIGEPAVEPLTSYLRQKKSSSARVGAVRVLAAIDSPAAAAPLLAALSDPDTRVRMESINGLLRADKDVDGSLVKLLGDGSGKSVSCAAIALGMRKDTRSIPYLIAALNDTDCMVRARAATVLGALRARDAIPPLVKALCDSDGNVRKCAVASLKEINDIRAVEQLIPLLRHDEELVRYASLEVMRGITEADYGTDAEEWGEWWKQHRAGLGSTDL